MSSPYLRERLQRAVEDGKIYYATGVHNDVGDHIEFLRKSITFVREAPIIGHGTGSIPELFRRSAVGQVGAAAVPSVNPHNQNSCHCDPARLAGRRSGTSGDVGRALLFVLRHEPHRLDWDCSGC